MLRRFGSCFQYPDMSTRPRKPCVFCYFLNVQCDVTWSPGGCRNCAVEFYTCMPLDTASYGLKEAFKSTMQIGHSEWVFYHDEGATIMTVDHLPLGPEAVEEHYILDLAQMPSYESRPDVSRLQFLNQFCTLTARWGFQYEPLTEIVIQRAAEYQAALCIYHEDVADQEETFLILSALRCLLHTHWVSIVYGSINGEFCDSEEEHTLITEAGIDNRGHARFNANAQVEVRYQLWDNLEDRYRKPRIENSATLCSIVGNTLQTAESLVLCRQPKDWPALFYTLFIMHLAYWDLSNCNSFTKSLDEARQLIASQLDTLARLFYICTGNGLQPMSVDFDSKWCSVLLGPSIQWDHYQELHTLWRDNREPEDMVFNETDFVNQLDRFSFGFVV